MNKILLFLSILAILFLTAYQASLFSMIRARTDSKWVCVAYHLAPRAFETLYLHASYKAVTDRVFEARQDIETLYSTYPSLPSVLYLVAVLRNKDGKKEEAIKLLRKAYEIDPLSNKIITAITWLENH